MNNNTQIVLYKVINSIIVIINTIENQKSTNFNRKLLNQALKPPEQQI